MKRITLKYKILLSVVIIIFLIPILLFFVLQNSRIQTYLASNIAERLEQKLETRIDIDRVELRFFNNVALEGMYIEDRQHDTLGYIKELTADIKRIRFFAKKIDLSEITINNSNIELREDTSGTNYDFILDAFSSDTKKQTKPKEAWSFSCDDFRLTNSKMSYNNENSKDTITGMDFNNIRLSRLNIDIRDVSVENTLSFTLKNLSFRDKSGFRLNTLSMASHITDSTYNLRDITLKTDKSDFTADTLGIALSSDSSGIKLEKSDFTVAIDNKSKLDFSDIGYFYAPFFEKAGHFKLKGNIQGENSNIEGTDFYFALSESTFIRSDFTLKKILHPDSMSFYVDFKEIAIRKNEMISRYKAFFPEKNIPEFTKKLDRLKDISYSGMLTGTINDFITDGTFYTPEGQISPSLNISEVESGKPVVNGDINVRNVNMGRFVGTQSLGQMTLNTRLEDMVIDMENPQGYIEGTFDKLSWNNYAYKDISFTTKIQSHHITSRIQSSDENLRFNLNSDFNYSKNTNEIFLNLNLDNANLYALNIDTTDELSKLNCKLKADFQGNNLNNATGSLNLSNARYTCSNGTLPMDTLAFKATQTANDERSLTLVSDYLNSSITGNFKYNELPSALKKVFFQAMPSLETSAPLNINSKKYSGNNHLKYSFQFKEINKITDIFFPKAQISTSVLQGRFNENEQYFSVNFSMDKLTYANSSFKDINIQAEADKEQFDFNLDSKNAALVDRFIFDNLNIRSDAKDDTINISTQWNNKESEKRYKGHIKATTIFEPSEKGEIPVINTNIAPSEIVIADSVWNIHETQITADSSYINITDWLIKHSEEEFRISGAISHRASDSLSLKIADFKLSNINPFLENIALKGDMNSKVLINDLYSDAYIAIDNAVNNFVVNDNQLGLLSLKGIYSQETGKLTLNTFIREGSRKQLQIKGGYALSDNALDFSMGLKNFPLNLINSFSNDVVSQVTGLASSDALQLTGSLEKPVITGDLKLQKVGLKVDYLNTKYYFTDTVKLRKDRIAFNELQISDNKGKTATITGALYHTYFDNIRLDINTELNGIKTLNTEYSEESFFYGKALASGFVNINGPAENLMMDISARTEENTRIFIPVDQGSEAKESDFVTFVSDTTKKTEKQNSNDDEYEADISGLGMNFDLEITPQAQIQLILNQQTGDVLKANGNGNIRLAAQPTGEFNIYGDYVIEEGSYVFTLQEVIRRKFRIESGSSINWNGDPYNAQLDIKTIYDIKNVSLYDLTLQNKYKNTKIPVQCEILIKGDLEQPQISFNVTLDNQFQDIAAQEQIQAQLENLTTEELNKQFLSLLVIKRFQPLPGFGSSQTNISSNYQNNLSSSASEVLTDQLGNWLSQIDEDLNVGINYNQNDSLSSSEIGVALSTQILNDRVNINGNINMKNEYTSSDNYVGNFNIEYKITQDGKLRIKYYNEINNNASYYEAPNKQGLGLFYTEGFNSLGELYQRYKEGFLNFWNNLFGG